MVTSSRGSLYSLRFVSEVLTNRFLRCNGKVSISARQGFHFGSRFWTSTLSLPLCLLKTALVSPVSWKRLFSSSSPRSSHHNYFPLVRTTVPNVKDFGSKSFRCQRHLDRHCLIFEVETWWFFLLHFFIPYGVGYGPPFQQPQQHTLKVSCKKSTGKWFSSDWCVSYTFGNKNFSVRPASRYNP